MGVVNIYMSEMDTEIAQRKNRNWGHVYLLTFSESKESSWVLTFIITGLFRPKNDKNETKILIPPAVIDSKYIDFV